MASTILNSAKVSSLTQALFKGKTDDMEFQLGIRQSSVPQAREYLEIAADQDAKSTGSNVVFSLPKLGYLKNACLKITMAATDISAYASDKGITWAPALAASIVESITLRSTSRQILQIDSYRIMELINQSENKDAYQKMAGYHWSYDTNTGSHSMPADQTKDLLGLKLSSRSDTYPGPVITLPIMLSCFADSKCALPLGFCESLSLVVRTRSVARYCAAANATVPSISMALGLDIAVLEQTAAKKTIDATFPPSRSAQIMLESSQLIGQSTKETPAGSDHTLTNIPINTTVTDLVRSLTFVAYPATNDESTTALFSDKFLKISRVSFRASGRILFDLDADSLSCMNLANRMGSKQLCGLSELLDELSPNNIVSVQMCQDVTNSSYYSSGMPCAGLSSQQFVVSVLSRSNTPFKVRIYANCVALRTISSDAGVITAALST